MVMIRVVFVFVSLVISGGTALCQDIAAGGRVAQMQCTGCHEVGNRQKATPGIAPSFMDIAATKGMTQLSIEVFLSTPHEKMPNYTLTQKQIRDVASYIMSLRQSEMTPPAVGPTGANQPQLRQAAM